MCVHVAGDCSPPLWAYQMGKSAIVFLPRPQWPTCVALSPSRLEGNLPAFIRSPGHRTEGGIDGIDPESYDVKMLGKWWGKHVDWFG